MNKAVTVSACIITYNQEAFIGKCLDNAVKQALDYRYRIIISDDNSTDNTIKICKEYRNRYPNLITIIERKKNLGVSGNFANTILSCGGDYIALCEGDDYWTDSTKLQKQVDFLEANSDFAICHHRVKIINDQDDDNFKLSPIQNEAETMESLCKGNFIHTVSTVFRNNSLEFQDWYLTLPIADWPLHLLNAMYGKIKYFDIPMAVYRRHIKGVYSGIINTDRQLSLLKTTTTCMVNFDRKYKKYFQVGIARIYLNLIIEYRFKKSIKAYYYFLKLIPIRNLIEPPISIKQLLRNLR
jgi:glycosyltransferase involved in cell wall biosynthesis